MLQMAKKWASASSGGSWLQKLPVTAQQAARAMLAPSSKVPDAQKHALLPCACLFACMSWIAAQHTLHR